MSGGRLQAVRGAITVDEDTREAVVAGTQELLETLLAENGLRPEDLVSILFTATPDLTAEFPAVAAREIGLSQVPLLCAQEIPVPGAIGRCIRVLVHCYRSSGGPVRHVYLREARSLRPDLSDQRAD